MIAPIVTEQTIDLVVTDLDGSFWDAHGRAHPDTLAALDVVMAAGTPVLAATARRPASVLDTMKDNGVLLPSVLFDGSLGRDFGVTSRSIVHSSIQRQPRRCSRHSARRVWSPRSTSNTAITTL